MFNKNQSRLVQHQPFLRLLRSPWYKSYDDFETSPSPPPLTFATEKPEKSSLFFLVGEMSRGHDDGSESLCIVRR